MIVAAWPMWPAIVGILVGGALLILAVLIAAWPMYRKPASRRTWETDR